MAKAVWNGEVIAESDDIVMVEANPYFPIGSVKDGVLTKSDSPPHLLSLERLRRLL